MSTAAVGSGVPAGRPERWRAVVALALLGMLAGLAWGIADRPRYEATASVFTARGSGKADPADLARLAQLGMSRAVAEEAAGLLGDDIPGADLLAEVSIVPAPDGVTLLVTASSEQPDFAAAAADGYAEALVRVAGEGPKGRAGLPLELGDAADLPSSPSADRSGLLWAGIGLLAGLCLGGLIALLLRGHGAGRPAASATGRAGPPFGVSVIASVAAPADAVGEEGPGRLRLRPAAIGPFREIVDELGLDGAGAPRTLAVLPMGAEAEAGSVALALAAAAAEVGLIVILVEADPAAPTVASRAAVAAEPGLAEYLAARAGPRDVLRSISVEAGAGEPFSFVAVPAGGPAAPFEGPRLEALLERLPRVYDLVVVQAPPPDGAGGGVGISSRVEGVLLLAAAAGLDDPALRERVDALPSPSLLGAVVVED